MRKGMMTPEEHREFKARLMLEMSQHVGATNIVGMGELFEKVFDRTWNHRINDTRPLRNLITELRYEGVPIVSKTSSTGGGYYLASAGSELKKYCDRRKEQALKILAQVAAVKKISMPELMGQMALEIK